jgi:TonB family protein
MKIKTIICVLLAFQLGVHAQEPKKKPSWTDTMPERDDAPGMKMQIEKEDDFGLDRSSLGFDRDELSSTEDTIQESTSQQMTNKIEIKKQLDNERKKNAAQLVKIKKLEAQRLEAQKNQVEQEKIAAQKLAEQKQAQEAVAVQKQAEKKEVQPENKQEEITQQGPKVEPVSISTYKWKKIKNVTPVYPPKAARKKAEGWVDVEITIDSTGNVIGARVLNTQRNSHIFDNSALKAVKKWKYDPPSKYGFTTKLSKTIRMVYQL